LLVEDEDLFGLAILEHHVGVEDVTAPHQWVHDNFWANLLQVLDINDGLVCLSKNSTLMEDNLLSVWQELCVPAEVSLCSDSSWQLGGEHEEWQQEHIIP